MQRTLQLSFLQIFILLLGLLFGDLVFSQGPDSNREDAEVGIDAQEQHDTKDLEELLKKYNKDQVKVIEDNSKIHNIESNSEDSEIRDFEIEAGALNSKISQIHKIKNEEKINPNEKLSESVRLVLQPLQILSEKKLESLLLETSKTSKLKPFFEKFPKAVTFSVGMIKNKEAIPSLVSVVEDKPRLLNFGVFMLATILVGLFLKKLFFSKDRSFLGLIFFFIIRIQLMLFLRVGIVYYFYSKEFTPASDVFKKVFL